MHRNRKPQWKIIIYLIDLPCLNKNKVHGSSSNHATLFSWSKWLAARITARAPNEDDDDDDDDDDVAQHGGHTPVNTESWFVAYVFDI